MRRGTRWAHGVVATALAALILAPGIAGAAPPCSVTLGGSIAFGTYDVFDPVPRDATVRLRLACPASNAPQVLISKGNSATYAAREMQSGGNVLRYNLYLDPARQQVWGDGTEGTGIFAPKNGNAQTNIYARIPAGQDAAAGAYSDSLVITVFL